jgi:tetratricopeptide (TPR) repeat protein
MSEAAAIYEKLIEKEKDSSVLYFNLAVIYGKLGRTAAAIDKLNKAVGIDPEYFEAYIGLGLLYADEKRYSDAALNFEKAQELDRKNSAVNFYLGMLYDKLKKRDQAIKQFREVIAVDPGFADAYNYLGYLYADAGENLDEAVALIKKAIELSPDNGAYIDSLGWAYFKKGMYKDAFTELDRAVKLEPDDPDIKSHYEAVRKMIKDE